MPSNIRKQLITTIQKNEHLRPLTRTRRLLVSPLRTIPYYFLAAVSHIKPFPLTFRTLWDTKMTCFLPEGNTFYYYGYCEANLTNFFIRFVQPGMTVLDVGAHVGFYSMLSSALVGKDGVVYSFEPTPHTFSLLQKNTHTLNNVTVENKAVSDTATPLSFADYGAGYSAYNTASSEGAQGINRTAHTITVGSVTLDHYCQEHSVTPSLIKIDAEGFEPHVLSGAKEILGNQTSSRPLITLEVAGGDEWADSRTQSFALLKSYGYQAFEIEIDGHIYQHNLKNSYTYDNLLFIPTERVEEITNSLA